MTITDNFMELIHVKLLALDDACLTAKGGECVHAISSHLISQLSNLKIKKQQYLSVPQNRVILNSNLLLRTKQMCNVYPYPTISCTPA